MKSHSTATSIYLPHYHPQKKRNKKFYHEGTTISTSNEFSLHVTIPVRENVGSLGKSTITCAAEPALKVYRQLSPKSLKKMSSCSSNQSMCALLGYIRKKRQANSSNKLPARRRRSFPKQTRRSSKKATRSRQHKRQKLQREVEDKPIPRVVPKFK